MAADPWIVLAAAAVEGVFGYPRRLPHPVVWIGAALRRLDAALNRGGDARRRAGGVLTLLVVAGLAAGVGHALDRFLQGWALILTIVAGSTGLAARSLYDHVAAVSQALSSSPPSP